MTEEERLLYMEQKRLAEEEMKKKKEDMLTQFLKVNRTNCTLYFLFNLDISSRNSVAVILPGSHILQWIEAVAKLIMTDWIMLQISTLQIANRTDLSNTYFAYKLKWSLHNLLTLWLISGACITELNCILLFMINRIPSSLLASHEIASPFSLSPPLLLPLISTLFFWVLHCDWYISSQDPFMEMSVTAMDNSLWLD